jgi:hypothetical protein
LGNNITSNEFEFHLIACFKMAPKQMHMYKINAAQHTPVFLDSGESALLVCLASSPNIEAWADFRLATFPGIQQADP